MPTLDLACSESLAALRDNPPSEGASRPRGIARRRALKSVLALLAASPTLLAAPRVAAAASRHINIGWQKGGSLAVIAARGELQKTLASRDISIAWREFPSGRVLLEALNAGSIDFGVVGETPPVFAQAPGVDLLYVGSEPAAPRAEKILVPNDSPLGAVADLRGKRIALNKGSNVHHLLLKLLDQAGIRYSDVEFVFLAPADARAAFERGSVDAWVIWVPYAAAVEARFVPRILADGTGVVNNFTFFIASRRYAEQNVDVLSLLLAQVQSEDQWIKNHLVAAAAIVAPQIGVAGDVAELTLSRYAYGVAPLSDDVVRQQQKVADAFFELRLIPRKLDVAAIVWRPAKLGEKS